MTERERMRLVEASGVSLSTVRKWSKGERVTEATRIALESAAKKLGIKKEASGGVR